MAAVRGWQRVRWVVVGGGLLAVVLLGPARAAAGCGDHVTILPSPPAGSPLAGSMPHAQESGSRPDTGQVPLRKPCSGPNCSGSPVREPSPLAPGAPPGSQPKELTEHPGTVNASDADPCSAIDREVTSTRPILQPAFVFRPPR
jgi:hypothetical protein